VHFDREVVGSNGFFVGFAAGENSRHIGHIGCEIAGEIDHNCFAFGYSFARGSDWQAGVEACAAEREVVGRRRCGIVAREQTSHKDVHIAKGAEDAERAVLPHQSFYFDLEIYIFHSFSENGRDFGVCRFVFAGGYAELLDFPRRFYHSCLPEQRCCIGRLSVFENGG